MSLVQTYHPYEYIFSSVNQFRNSLCIYVKPSTYRRSCKHLSQFHHSTMDLFPGMLISLGLPHNTEQVKILSVCDCLALSWNCEICTSVTINRVLLFPRKRKLRSLSRWKIRPTVLISIFCRLESEMIANTQEVHFLYFIANAIKISFHAILKLTKKFACIVLQKFVN